ncbi:MAG TPA: ATP-dependent DNA helicase, partial [Bacteroidales bacterium]|nr:ATP-dependent DNA helicase [Bacteroidales bacterium]
MKISEIIQLPEGRKLDFKQKVPTSANLAKTIVAFANDAGGAIYIGVKDKPREIIGVPEEELIAIEEQLSNMIFDNCAPPIIPNITFLQSEDKHLIKIQVHKGNTPPYYLKKKGLNEGVYIRVGSVSRQASDEMIAELTRRRHNISFDSEINFAKTLAELNLESLGRAFQKSTGQLLDETVLLKLELTRTEQGMKLPSNALILLSDDEIKNRVFPNAIIECARFKGTDPGNFIDQKTITGSIISQPDEAYQFVLRHISEYTTGYVSVYRKDRWEYPVFAVREAIRNAIIHRDYSMTGQDIKIAVFDNRIEITSPGKLSPSIDYDDMESGQSEIRNKTLAPVFKMLGIIEKWGNGLKLIANELRKYPDIGLTWNEPGVSFRVIFYKKNYDDKPYHSAHGTTMVVSEG